MKYNMKHKTALITAVICLAVLLVGMLGGCSPKKFLVSFDWNYADAGENPAAIEVTAGKAYGELPAVTVQRAGYTFGGWYLDADCEGEEVTADSVMTKEENHTLYAKWIGNKINVSFDLQGGNINGATTAEDATVTVGNVYGMLAIPEDPALHNHAFLGWYYDPEGTEGPVLTSTKVSKTEDHTLYAKWFYCNETGVLAPHNVGVNKDGSGNITGIYANSADVSLPYNTDWSVEYAPTAFENYKLIRGDETYNIGNPSYNLLVLFGQNELYLKLDNWVIGNDRFPVQDGDILVVEGEWACNKDATSKLNIATTYILFKNGAAIFSDTMPGAEDLFNNETGVLSSHVDGITKDNDKITGIHATGTAVTVPYNADWSVEYAPALAENYKLIRGGETYNVGNSSYGILVLFGKSDLYFKLADWIIGGDRYPVQDGDILVIEGEWFCKNDESSKLNIATTYILFKDGAATFSDTMPDLENPFNNQTGVLSSHKEGITKDASSNITGIHATGAAVTVPYNVDWSVEYAPALAGNYKLIRGGKTYDVGNRSYGILVLFGESELYFKLDNWIVGGDRFPVQDGDILVIEGEWFCRNDESAKLNIATTYILFKDGTATFSDTMPDVEIPSNNETGVLAPHYGGINKNGDGNIWGIYATGAAVTVPFNTDWSVEYAPTAFENYKLIRGGETYNIGNPSYNLLVLFGESELHFKLEDWVVGDRFPVKDGDILVIEGEWVCNKDASAKLNIATTYIQFKDGTATFSDTMPDVGSGDEDTTNNETGVLTSHYGGVSKDGDNITGVYATGTAVTVPFNTDWSVEYAPALSENYKLIRGGETHNIGSGDGLLVLFGESDLYFKLPDWRLGDLFPVQDGDILVIEGEWVCRSDENAKLNIATTYILFKDGAATFSDAMPDAGSGDEDTTNNETGVLSSHYGGINKDGDGNITGIYAAGTAVTVTYNSDWSVEYAPTAFENYKLIRNGETYGIGNPSYNLLVLFGESDLYFKLDNWVVGGDRYPVQDGDILVIEGEWVCAKDASSKLNIATTYILFKDGTATFSDTMPSA